jgi:peptidylprolyl isomerase
LRWRRGVWALFAVAAVVLAITACSGRRDAGPIAEAAEERLGVAEVREMLDQLPANTRDALRSDKAALEQYVRAELVRRTLIKEAAAVDFDSDPKVAGQLQRARDEALVRLWIAKQATVSDEYPSEEDLKLAYQVNSAALTPPVQYRVAQIFVSAPNGVDPARLAVAMRKAAEVGSRLPGGDFAALARAHSEHAESAARGGDVGLLAANQMLPEILTAVRNLEVGATAGPVKTSQGLHYVKLLDKKVEPLPSFEDSRGQLRAALRARRVQELEQAYLAALNAKLNVAVDQIALAQMEAVDNEAAKD